MLDLMIYSINARLLRELNQPIEYASSPLGSFHTHLQCTAGRSVDCQSIWMKSRIWWQNNQNLVKRVLKGAGEWMEKEGLLLLLNSMPASPSITLAGSTLKLYKFKGSTECKYVACRSLISSFGGNALPVEHCRRNFLVIRDTVFNSNASVT